MDAPSSPTTASPEGDAPWTRPSTSCSGASARSSQASASPGQCEAILSLAQIAADRKDVAKHEELQSNQTLLENDLVAFVERVSQEFLTQHPSPKASSLQAELAGFVAVLRAHRESMSLLRESTLQAESRTVALAAAAILAMLVFSLGALLAESLAAAAPPSPNGLTASPTAMAPPRRARRG